MNKRVGRERGSVHARNRGSWGEKKVARILADRDQANNPEVRVLEINTKREGKNMV